MKLGIDTSALIASVKKKAEKFHDSAILLSDLIKDRGHRVIVSSLVLIELPGALIMTTMPLERIFEIESSVQENFNLEILSYEDYVDRTIELMMEFRDLKRALKIGAADFHHLATSVQEKCEMFITVDEHHLLMDETKQAFKKYINILDPNEALPKLKGEQNLLDMSF